MPGSTFDYEEDKFQSLFGIGRDGTINLGGGKIKKKKKKKKKKKIKKKKKKQFYLKIYII
jgi:hypothetical protein